MAEKEKNTTDFGADPSNFVNRELSWLEFNYRVLSEARDKSLPLFERLKFLSITASNLDEFYMVRVASLKDMVHAKYMKQDIAGMTAQEQLDAISIKTHQLVELQYSTYIRSLVPSLRQNGLRIIMEHEDLTKEEAACADSYFQTNPEYCGSVKEKERGWRTGICHGAGAFCAAKNRRASQRDNGGWHRAEGGDPFRGDH